MGSWGHTREKHNLFGKWSFSDWNSHRDRLHVTGHRDVIHTQRESAGFTPPLQFLCSQGRQPVGHYQAPMRWNHLDRARTHLVSETITYFSETVKGFIWLRGRVLHLYLKVHRQNRQRSAPDDHEANQFLDTICKTKRRFNRFLKHVQKSTLSAISDILMIIQLYLQ